MNGKIPCDICKYRDTNKDDEPCASCFETDLPMESVDHPAHYSESSIECIQAMSIAFGKKAVIWFCLCNAFKYIWRHKSKNGEEDLSKAQWYLKHATENQKHMTYKQERKCMDLQDLLEEIEGNEQLE